MSYPTRLPLPVRDGYSGQVKSPTRRTLMEDGQNRQRRLWSSQFFNMSLSWRLSWFEAEYFEAWLEYAVNQGTGWFEVPFNGETITVQPVTGMPTYTAQGGYWLVTLEVRRRTSAPVSTPNTGLPVWPQSLPTQETDGFVLQATDAVMVSDLDGGKPEMRVRFQDRVKKYSGTLILNPAQREDFWEFYEQQLFNGNAWFLGPFSSASYQGLVRARILPGATESANGSHFNVMVEMETVNAPMLSRQAFLDGYRDFLSTYIEEGYYDEGYIGEYSF